MEGDGADIFHFEEVLLISLAHFVHIAREHHPRVVDECDLVANLLHRGHVVRRENQRSPLGLEAEHFALELLGIDGVEAAKGFVEDEQCGPMHDGDDELHLLLHALRELLQAPVPPSHDVEPFEPLRQARPSIGGTHPFQPREVERLLADLHFLVQAALLGQIANVADVVRVRRVSVEADGATVRGRNTVDDTYERRLSGAIRPQ